MLARLLLLLDKERLRAGGRSVTETLGMGGRWVMEEEEEEE